MNDTINQIKHVKNDERGQIQLAFLREFFKGTRYRVVLRGRGPRKPHVGINGKSHRNLRQDLPLSVATHFGVYITERPKYRYVNKTVTEWVKQPTKWAKQVSV